MAKDINGLYFKPVLEEMNFKDFFCANKGKREKTLIH